MKQPSMFNAFCGNEIRCIHSVFVVLPELEVRLCDTAFFELGDHGLQVLVDDSCKLLRSAGSASDIVIWGDYGDRLGMRLKPWPIAGLDYPFIVEKVLPVSVTGFAGHWKGFEGQGEEYWVGAILRGGGQRLAIRTDIDELHLESEEAFSHYLHSAYGDSVRIWG